MAASSRQAGGPTDDAVTVVLCCARADADAVRIAADPIAVQGHPVELVDGLDTDPKRLAVVLQHRGSNGLYVLCRSRALNRKTTEELRELLLAHHVPFGRTLTVTADRPQDLVDRIQSGIARVKNQRARRTPATLPIAGTSAPSSRPPSTTTSSDVPFEDQVTTQRDDAEDPRSPDLEADTVASRLSGSAKPLDPTDKTVTVTHPTPTVNQSAATVNQSATTVNQSATTVNQSATTVNQSAPTVSQSAPTVNQSAKTVSQSAKTLPHIKDTTREEDTVTLHRAEPPRADVAIPYEDTVTALRADSSGASLRSSPPPPMPTGQGQSPGPPPPGSSKEWVEDEEPTLVGGEHASSAPLSIPPHSAGDDEPLSALDLSDLDSSEGRPPASPRPSSPMITGETVVGVNPLITGETVVAAAPEPPQIPSGPPPNLGRDPSTPLAVDSSPPPGLGVLAAAASSSPPAMTRMPPPAAAPFSPSPTGSPYSSGLGPSTVDDEKSEARSSRVPLLVGGISLLAAVVLLAVFLFNGDDNDKKAANLQAEAKKAQDVTSDDSPTRQDGGPDAVPENRPLSHSSYPVMLALQDRHIRALDLLLLAEPGPDAQSFKDAASVCGTLDVKGLQGWRLPEIGELNSLSAAQMLRRGIYWSSTVGDMFGDTHMAWNTVRKKVLQRETPAYTVCVRGQRPNR